MRNKLKNLFLLLPTLAVFFTTLEITAYHTGTVTCYGNAPIPYWTCAADDLPQGTKVTVNGHTWVVDDCFGGGYKNKLDLFMTSYDECINWGRQNVYCKIETPE